VWKFSDQKFEKQIWFIFHQLLILDENPFTKILLLRNEFLPDIYRKNKNKKKMKEKKL